MKTALLFIVNLFAVILTTSAQKQLTLDEYRNMVIDYSRRLKISEESVLSAEQKYKMVRTGYLPSISASATANYQVGNKISFGTMTLKDYNYSSQVTLQQSIYAGGAVRAQTKSAGIAYDLSQIDSEVTLQSVSYSADVTYWAFAASAEQLDISKQYVQIIKNLYNIINIRFADGSIARTDLLMVETRLNEANLQFVSANKLYLNSLRQINTLLGNDQIEPYGVGDSISNIPAVEKVLSLNEAMDIRPEYRQAMTQIDLQRQNLKVARSRYNPQFSVGVQGVLGTPSLNFTGDSKFYGVAFASLNIPIFMWGERRYNVSMVRSAIRSSELALSDTRDRIGGEVSSAKIDLKRTFELSQISFENLRVASENLELNTFSYNEGRLPILDVLQSQLAWIQAYTSYVNSNYSYRIAVADYNKAIGGYAL